MKTRYGERLRAAMKIKNVTQLKLAQQLQITRTAVSKILGGSQYLDFDLAVKACEFLEISLDWLAYGKEAVVPFHRDPNRQRIEYLLSLIKNADYPLVIVALEEIIELRTENE